MFHFVFYIFYIVVVVCGCWQNGPPPRYWFLVIRHLFCTPILILGFWTSSSPWMWLTIQTGVLFTNFFPEYFWVTISMLIKSNVKRKMMKKFLFTVVAQYWLNVHTWNSSLYLLPKINVWCVGNPVQAFHYTCNNLKNRIPISYWKSLIVFIVC